MFGFIRIQQNLLPLISLDLNPQFLSNLKKQRSRGPKGLKTDRSFIIDPKMREEEIEKLRGVVRDCVSKLLYSSAIFFADKVAALTNDPADVYMQAQALFLGRHYRRAFHLLNVSKIVLPDLRFRYLAAKLLLIIINFQISLLFNFFYSIFCAKSVEFEQKYCCFCFMICDLLI